MRVCYLLFCLLIWHQVVSAQHARFNSQPYVTIYTGSNFDFVGTGDVNGDGLTDVIGVTNYDHDIVHDFKLLVWLQDANGQLQPVQRFPYTVSSGARSLAVCDLYGDGTAEVIVGVSGCVKIYGWINNALLLQDSLVTVPSLGQDALATGDFDGDGFTDIGIYNDKWDRISVIYQNGAGGAKWDMRDYNVVTTGLGQLTAGKFGTQQQTALVALHSYYVRPLTIMTFTSARTMQQQYDVLPSGNTIDYPQSVAFVNNELWLTHGANTAYISVWRGLTPLPDSTFRTLDLPNAIQAANLDCDEDDEPVVLHGGWNHITVYTNDDTASHYIVTASHFQKDALALGDINNDGFKDICIANRNYSELLILYNTTPPCWPAAVTPPLDDTKQLLLYPNPATERIHIQHPPPVYYR